MGRNHEYAPGEVAEVWVHNRKTGEQELRGEVQIEDLVDVLTRISNRTGANGPQSPVTQFILRQAAEHLAEGLAGDIESRDGREPLPRMLSTSLGHQPFIEGVLDMSQHQMLRRWPMATDWYGDLVAYILRAVRFRETKELVRASLPLWLQLPFGELVRRFATEHLVVRSDQRLFRVAEAIQALWPDYEPVRESQRNYRRLMHAKWDPVFRRVMEAYDLHLAPGVSLSEVTWAFNAAHWREVQELLSDPEGRPDYSNEGDDRWTRSARSGLLIVAGSVVDADGMPIAAAVLAQRKARVPSDQVPTA
jgi:hypothetical protein